MIDRVELDAAVEVEELCLGRKLNSKEKANFVVTFSKAKWAQIFPLKDFSSKDISFNLFFYKFGFPDLASFGDYEVIEIDDNIIVLCVYRIKSRRAILRGNANPAYAVSFDLPYDDEWR